MYALMQMDPSGLFYAAGQMLGSIWSLLNTITWNNYPVITWVALALIVYVIFKMIARKI